MLFIRGCETRQAPRTSSLEAFYDEVEAKLIPKMTWGRNLDAFNDILRGGFGTPEGGFVLRWSRSVRARQQLGYPATVEYLERKVKRCHPTAVAAVQADLEAERRGEGPTLFEILVDIVRRHGPGGDEARDGVELELA
jgi:barstar (barnase inhibitor)